MSRSMTSIINQLPHFQIYLKKEGIKVKAGRGGRIGIMAARVRY
jgi:hypothetical protein